MASDGSLRCSACGHEHPWAYSGSCLACGEAVLTRSVVARESMAIRERIEGEAVREFLEENPAVKWTVRGITFGAPFLGLAVAGLPGVGLGIAAGGLTYWLGPRAVMKVREIRKL